MVWQHTYTKHKNFIITWPHKQYCFLWWVPGYKTDYFKTSPSGTSKKVKMYSGMKLLNLPILSFYTTSFQTVLQLLYCEWGKRQLCTRCCSNDIIVLVGSPLQCQWYLYESVYLKMHIPQYNCIHNSVVLIACAS